MENAAQHFTVVERGTEKCLLIPAGFSSDRVPELLHELREKYPLFEIYDPFYPSPSDPGAYISYSRAHAQSADTWGMTLGNHGWTGGIYQIPDAVVRLQLANLVKQNKLNEIQVSRVAFFGHYAVQPEASNLNMIDRLKAAHKG